MAEPVPPAVPVTGNAQIDGIARAVVEFCTNAVAEMRRSLEAERALRDAEHRAAMLELRALKDKERAISVLPNAVATRREWKTLENLCQAVCHAVAELIGRSDDKIADMTAKATAAEERREATFAVRMAALMEGRYLKVRGTWDASNTYNDLDVVALNGGSFVARYDNPGPCPGPGWQLMATQGKQGKPGTRVEALRLNESVLTLRNSDGSVLTVDLGPALRKMASPATAEPKLSEDIG